MGDFSAFFIIMMGGLSGEELSRGNILNITYDPYKNLPGIYFAIFTHNIWSYLLWSPVIAQHTNIFFFVCPPNIFCDRST